MNISSSANFSFVWLCISCFAMACSKFGTRIQRCNPSVFSNVPHEWRRCSRRMSAVHKRDYATAEDLLYHSTGERVVPSPGSFEVVNVLPLQCGERLRRGASRAVSSFCDLRPGDCVVVGDARRASSSSWHIKNPTRTLTPLIYVDWTLQRTHLLFTHSSLLN